MTGRIPLDQREHRPEPETPRSYASVGQDVLRVGPEPKHRDIRAMYGMPKPADEIRPLFYEKRQALHYLRRHIPDLEAQRDQLVEANGSADDWRLLTNQIDLARFNLRNLESEVPGLRDRLASLGEEHTID